jgi:hypothetical protein
MGERDIILSPDCQRDKTKYEYERNIPFHALITLSDKVYCKFQVILLASFNLFPYICNQMVYHKP